MQQDDLWIVRHRPNSLARFRIFCFPLAGGNASAFQSWPDSFPEDIEICAIQFPGRQHRSGEPPYRRMPLLIHALEKAICPYLDVPFAIFGACTGSLAGYELAQRLQRTISMQPVHLFASCCRAPHMPDRDKPIHGLPEDALWAELDRLGGTPPIVLGNPELKTMLSPVLRADFELAETYHYRSAPPLSCPLTVFGGLEDEIINRDELEGWRQHTTGPFAVKMVEGGHYLLNSETDELAQALNAVFELRAL